MSVQTELRKRKIATEARALMALHKWRLEKAHDCMDAWNPVRAHAYITGYRDSERVANKSLPEQGT